MTRADRLRQALLDLALAYGAVPRARLRAPERQRLRDAVARAQAVITGASDGPVTRADAEDELAAALARCSDAGLDWHRVTELLNDWSERTPQAHRSGVP